jgi:hypothetical protein
MLSGLIASGGVALWQALLWLEGRRWGAAGSGGAGTASFGVGSGSGNVVNEIRGWLGERPVRLLRSAVHALGAFIQAKQCSLPLCLYYTRTHI